MSKAARHDNTTAEMLQNMGENGFEIFSISDMEKITEDEEEKYKRQFELVQIIHVKPKREVDMIETIGLWRLMSNEKKIVLKVK